MKKIIMALALVGGAMYATSTEQPATEPEIRYETQYQQGWEPMDENQRFQATESTLTARQAAPHLFKNKEIDE